MRFIKANFFCFSFSECKYLYFSCASVRPLCLSFFFFLPVAKQVVSLSLSL